MSQQQTTFPRIWTEIINNILPINGVLKPDTSVVKRERTEGKQKKKRGGWGGVGCYISSAIVEICLQHESMSGGREGMWEQGCSKHNKYQAATMMK